jgi:hypothetical protein
MRIIITDTAQTKSIRLVLLLFFWFLAPNRKQREEPTAFTLAALESMRFDVRMCFGVHVANETVPKLYWLADVRDVEERLRDTNAHALFHSGNTLPRVIAEYVVDDKQKLDHSKYDKPWMLLTRWYFPLQMGCATPSDSLVEDHVYVLYFPLVPNGYDDDGQFQLTASFLQGFFAALDATPLRQLLHDLGVQYTEPTLQSFDDT